MFQTGSDLPNSDDSEDKPGISEDTQIKEESFDYLDIKMERILGIKYSLLVKSARLGINVDLIIRIDYLSIDFDLILNGELACSNFCKLQNNGANGVELKIKVDESNYTQLKDPTTFYKELINQITKYYENRTNRKSQTRI